MAAHRFLFRGEAVGVAGHIRRPADIVIPPQASLSLPIIGGGGKSTVKSGSFSGIVSFGSAVVSVHGDYVPPAKAITFTHGNHQENTLPTKTTVTTEVRDLSIVSSQGRSRGRTLTIARLATTLESTHSRKKGFQPKFTTRLAIEGMAIDGHRFEIEFADKLLAIQTYDGLYKAPPGKSARKSPRDEFSDLFEPWPTKDKKAKTREERPLYELCTACKKITSSGRALAKVLGPNRIQVKDFGTIYIAEMVLSPVDRRLALIRIEMGSPIGGDVMASGSGLDGHDWPPS